MSEQLKHHRITRDIIHDRAIDRQRDYTEVYGENSDEAYVLKLLAGEDPRHDEPGQAQYREIDTLFDKILMGHINDLVDTTSHTMTARNRALEKKQREVTRNQKL